MCALSIIFGLQSYYQTLIGPLSNVFPTACVGIAFYSSYLCLRKYKFNLRRRFEAIWFFFTLGTGIWVIAEATWAVYYFAFGVTLPYPSIADVFYIGGYFPILVGALLYIGVFRVALSARRILAALLVIAVAVALAMTYVLPIEFSTGKPLALVFTDLIYPILDLSLVSVAVLGVAIFFGGRMSRWWLLLGATACLYVVGDEFFLYQVAAGTYYNGDLDDLIFLFGYLTGALAFYVHRREF